MNDPHVVALLYSIGHDDSVDYSEAVRIEHEEEPFRVTIEDKVDSLVKSLCRSN